MTLKFDDNGTIIPRHTKEEIKSKITHNLREYNLAIQAKNNTNKIAESLALVTIIHPEDLESINSKISPELQEKINNKLPAIRAAVDAGIISINYSKYDRVFKNIVMELS